MQTLLTRVLAGISVAGCLSIAATAQESTAPGKPEASRELLQRASEHMQRLSMRLAEGEDEVERNDRPLLTFGDAARANKNGTLWAFGKSGRPLAMVELYLGANGRWAHAATLTGGKLVRMTNPTGVVWSPQKLQIEPAPIASAAVPDPREPARLRQMKELARRFTAHEFWDPDNSRFELRLLISSVQRYSDKDEQIQDGAAFILAHGTNPEVVLLIEAIGKKVEESRWHYSLARLGSAELHVELDGKAVWAQGRTPGVVGQPSDPYWLFLSPAGPPE